MAGNDRELDSTGRTYVRVAGSVAALICGEDDVEKWDDEELLRGRRRAKDGTFRGGEPVLIPAQVYEEFKRRQLERVEQAFMENVAAAAQNLADMAADKNLDAAIRLRAQKMLLDRVLGRPTESVEVRGHLKHEQVIEQVTINRDELAATTDDIVDAEVVEDDGFDFDWEGDTGHTVRMDDGDDWDFDT